MQVTLYRLIMYLVCVYVKQQLYFKEAINLKEVREEYMSSLEEGKRKK